MNFWKIINADLDILNKFTWLVVFFFLNVIVEWTVRFNYGFLFERFSAISNHLRLLLSYYTSIPLIKWFPLQKQIIKYLISKGVKCFDAALIFTTQCAELVNPIEGQPRSDAPFHHDLPNSVDRESLFCFLFWVIIIYITNFYSMLLAKIRTYLCRFLT